MIEQRKDFTKFSKQITRNSIKFSFSNKKYTVTIQTNKTQNKTIVLFTSLRNCKRRNKGNFTLKSNSNKIMLCGPTLS